MNSQRNIRILIAEDDYLVSQEISRTLKLLGYGNITTANNGEKAVEIALKTEPDIILMDIKMPKLDGLEAARRIHEKASIPVVILTAHESTEYIQLAVDSGVGAYLTKPARPEEIERAISIALARHQDLEKSLKLIHELEESKKQLNELIATKDKFFKIIAHDLKNPLFGIQGLLDLLNKNYNEFNDIEKKEIIESIKNSTDKVSELLQNLLHWARVQDGSLKAEPEKLWLSEVVEAAIHPLLFNAKEKQIAIKINSETGIRVKADKFMLTTIVRNLVNNGIKFTTPGGSVSIIMESADHFAKVSVIDTGIGMDPATINKLFHIDQGFSKTGTAGETGTGLGLMLCREFVEKILGTISADSMPGKGSKFVFTIPLA